MNATITTAPVAQDAPTRGDMDSVRDELGAAELKRGKVRRNLRVVTILIWFVILIGCIYQTVNVTLAISADDGAGVSPFIAWMIDPFAIAALAVTVLLGQATAEFGIAEGFKSALLRWVGALITLGLNTAHPAVNALSSTSHVDNRALHLVEVLLPALATPVIIILLLEVAAEGRAKIARINMTNDETIRHLRLRLANMIEHTENLRSQAELRERERERTERERIDREERWQQREEAEATARLDLEREQVRLRAEQDAHQAQREHEREQADTRARAELEKARLEAETRARFTQLEHEHRREQAQLELEKARLLSTQGRRTQSSGRRDAQKPARTNLTSTAGNYSPVPRDAEQSEQDSPLHDGPANLSRMELTKRLAGRHQRAQGKPISGAQLARELTAAGHRISERQARRELHELGFTSHADERAAVRDDEQDADLGQESSPPAYGQKDHDGPSLESSQNLEMPAYQSFSSTG
jgi:hypothetical protein